MGILKRLFNRGGSGEVSQPAETRLATPSQVAAERQLPPPQGRNNYLIVILDSCRYDAFMEARPRTVSALGEVQRRWSYASWTAPSHYNLLMGLLPHSSPQQVYASEYYKQDFFKYQERLGAERIEFKSLVPQLFLPTFLKWKLGYHTHAMVSLPVLNPATLLNKDFDSFTLMPTHNDMAAMVERLSFSPDRPSFYLLNVGETHYPYALPNEPSEEWPKIHGVHGSSSISMTPSSAGSLLKMKKGSGSSIKTNSTASGSDRSMPCAILTKCLNASSTSSPPIPILRLPQTTASYSVKRAISDTVPSIMKKPTKSPLLKASCVKARLPHQFVV